MSTLAAVAAICVAAHAHADYINLTPQTALLEDPTGSLTIDDMVRAEFREPGKASFNLGIRNTTLWLRFRMAPGAFGTETNYLEITNPRLELVTLYRVDALGDAVVVGSTGSRVHVGQRPFPYRKLIIPLAASDREATYYLHVRNKGSLRLALHLWRPEVFAGSLARSQILVGLFYGLLAAMALYHFSLYLSLRENIYLYYVLLVVAYGLFHAALTGVAQQYLWPNATVWADRAILFFNGLSMFFALAFTASFLELRQRLRGSFALFPALMVLSLLVSVGVFIPSIHANMLAHVIGLFGPAALFVAAAVLWWRGLQSAWLFLLGWTATLVGTTVFALMGFGVVAENLVTANGVHAGFAVALLLFSLALAERVKRIEQAHRERLISLNGLLTQRIAECAAEMQERNESLRDLATRLTKAEQAARRQLSQTLHDHLQQLLVAVQLRLGQLRHSPLNEDDRHTVQEAERLLKESVAASRDMAAELNPPVLQREGLEAGLEWLSRLMESRHGLSVTVSADNPLHRIPQEHAVLLFEISRELLFNIVKHAGTKCARIYVHHRPDGWIQIAVEDEGVGFDPESIGGQTTASGFGLAHIRERLIYLGGSMQITSVRGSGTRIQIETPTAIPQN